MYFCLYARMPAVHLGQTEELFKKNSLLQIKMAALYILGRWKRAQCCYTKKRELHITHTHTHTHTHTQKTNRIILCWRERTSVHFGKRRCGCKYFCWRCFNILEATMCVCACVCVRVCVCERERVCVCVCVCVSE
jgi:hypothetical protein